MKKIFMLVVMTLLLAAVPSMAQNPGYGGYGGMGPGMMGGYGYGMGPGMMGGYGGYGYGMGPGMMGGYGGYGGYGMGPGMMGGYGGYGMGPGMMGNYGYGRCPNCGAYQGPQFKSNEDYYKFLDATKEQRRKLQGLMFEYNEEMRSPNPDREKLAKIGKEMDELRSEIYNYNEK